MALHASHLIRKSRVCPVNISDSLKASVVGERQETPQSLKKSLCSDVCSKHHWEHVAVFNTW